jgi:outer membrane protein OmpA-like peptidoglycan-associated protein
MDLKLPYRLSAIGLLLIFGLFSGCASMEFAPKKQIWYYHKELPAADRAVAAAKAAGKDKECPADFAAVEKMKNDAYEIYWSCRTEEARAKANEAAARANALCPKKAEAPKPMPAKAPPPPPPIAPTVSISANPASIEQGKCAKLDWSSTGASSASIDQGIGAVDPGGSREVCPAATTQYTITAKGEGGAKTATTTVNVTPPPPPPAPKVVDRLAIHVNFDTAKADIRKSDVAELQKAIDFVKKYPGYAISVEGHTDNRGKAKYNQTLSEKRAAAVKKYLVDKGVQNGNRIKATGYGLTKPIADNKTEKGRFENRRVEIVILTQ